MRHILLTVLISLVSLNHVSSQRLNAIQLSSFEELRIEQFEIAPDKSWHIILGDNDYLRSYDQGGTWTSLNMPDSLVVNSIHFFEDSSPLILSERQLYLYNNLEWQRINNQDLVRDIEIYNDTLFVLNYENKIFQSNNKGLDFDILIQSSEPDNWNKLDLSDNHFYIVSGQYKNILKKYDRGFNIVRCDTLCKGYVDYLSVSSNDLIIGSQYINTSAQDGPPNQVEVFGGYDAYSTTCIGTTNLFIYSVIIHKEKAIYSHSDSKIEVYDPVSDIQTSYDIDVTGNLRTDGEDLFIFRNNGIYNISDYENGILSKVELNLKRNYSNVSQYWIAPNNDIIAYTDYNFLLSKNEGLTWSIIFEDHRTDYVDFEITPNSTFILLTKKYTYTRELDNIEIRTPHNLWWSSSHLASSLMPSDLVVYNDSIYYLFMFGANGFSYPTINSTIDKGENYGLSFSDPTVRNLFQFQGEPHITLGNDIYKYDFFTDVSELYFPTDSLSELPGTYYLLPIDSALIHYNPRFSTQYSYISDDYGKSHNRLGLSPRGSIIKGKSRESTFVTYRNDLYFRSDLKQNYQQVDITSLENISTLQSNSVGDIFLIAKNIYSRTGPLYKIDNLLYHPQTISGQLYLDDNNNCSYENDEDIITEAWQFTIEGNNYHLSTFSIDGTYSFDIPIGDYTLTVHKPSERWTLCDSTFTLSIDEANQEIIQNIGIKNTELCSAIKVDLSTHKLRRCGYTYYSVTIKNTGTIPSEPFDININLDRYFEIINSNSFIIINDSTLTRSIPSLGIGEIATYNFFIKVSCEAPLGFEHCISYQILDINQCSDITTNPVTEYQLNVGPFDPNDMRVFNKEGRISYTFDKQDDQYYHVRYQNTGTDTAYNVKVIVDLDSKLDLSSISMIGSSHDYSLHINDKNNLELRFSNIMLPDSFVNEPASNGFFKFKITPIESIDYGQELFSHSDIYFDFNSPIRTNEAKSIIGIPCPENEIKDLNKEICQGETFQDKSRSEFYYTIDQDSNGCDSITRINLIVHNRHSSISTLKLCGEKNYLGHSENIILSDTLSSSYGCDSIIRTSLIFHKLTEATNEYTYLCPQDSLYNILSESITSDTTYSNFLKTCIINNRIIEKLDSTPININNNICEGDSYLGHYTSGTYIDTLMSTYGCDSIIILELNIIEPDITTQTITICEGEAYDNYTTAGMHIDTLINSLGCDSITVLNLTILENIVTHDTITICEGEKYLDRDIAGDYTDRYTSVVGCDSISNLHLIVLPIETSECNTTNVNETILESRLYIYPNPTNEFINISSELPIDRIKIFDAFGNEVLNNEYSKMISLKNLTSGIYFIQFTFFNGQKISSKVLLL
ncbi:T9SS type A sorting domain-containing protein [Saprospiraceae bacterium]|nr:T9SS type A sorting domain-containing protein [Saprospiraceae bacterium]